MYVPSIDIGRKSVPQALSLRFLGKSFFPSTPDRERENFEKSLSWKLSPDSLLFPPWPLSKIRVSLFYRPFLSLPLWSTLVIRDTKQPRWGCQHNHHYFFPPEPFHGCHWLNLFLADKKGGGMGKKGPCVRSSSLHGVGTANIIVAFLPWQSLLHTYYYSVMNTVPKRAVP